MSLIHSLKVGGMVCVVGLMVAFYQRGQEIERLQTEKQAQTEQIEQQQKAYQTLQQHLEEERQASLQQKEVHNEIQQKQESVQREVRTIIQSQPCSGVAIDHRALERLRN